MNFNTDQEAQGQAAAGGSGDTSLDALNETDPTFITDPPRKPQGSRNMMILGGLGVVLAGVVYFMYFRSGPQSAGAAEGPAGAAAATSAAGANSVKTFLADGEGHVKLMQQMLQNTEKVVQRF